MVRIADCNQPLLQLEHAVSELFKTVRLANALTEVKVSPDLRRNKLYQQWKQCNSNQCNAMQTDAMQTNAMQTNALQINAMKSK